MKARIYVNHPECLFTRILSLSKFSSENSVEIDVDDQTFRRWSHATNEFEQVQADIQHALNCLDIDPRRVHYGPTQSGTVPPPKNPCRPSITTWLEGFNPPPAIPQTLRRP